MTALVELRHHPSYVAVALQEASGRGLNLGDLGGVSEVHLVVIEEAGGTFI